jgi:taspase (threonine aspartase 1)
MRDSLNLRRNTNLQAKLDNARDRFRRIGYTIQRPFRSPKTCNIRDLILEESIVNPYIHPTCSSTLSLFSRPHWENLEAMEPPLPAASDGNIASAMDGIVEKRSGKTRGSGMSQPVSAIFVHAGAGYHSITNERVHLAACSE